MLHSIRRWRKQPSISTLTRARMSLRKSMTACGVCCASEKRKRKEKENQSLSLAVYSNTNDERIHNLLLKMTRLHRCIQMIYKKANSCRYRSALLAFSAVICTSRASILTLCSCSFACVRRRSCCNCSRMHLISVCSLASSRR